MKCLACSGCFLLLSILGLLFPACDSSPPVGGPAAETDPPRTIVLVSIDTWRRDATGFLGGLDPSPTPFLDRLAQRGLVASDAMAPVPLTGPSHWSMLSGRWPWRDGMRVNGDQPTRVEESPNLAEILREQGWRTAAFVSCAVLSQRSGFAAGFDHFDERFQRPGGITALQMAERRGDATVAAALAWLEDQQLDARIFLWIHLFDPHLPWALPPGIFVGEHGAYYAEIAFADQQLERFSERLSELGRPLDESLWVVLSDHGEALGAHGEATHGPLLHGATTRIPLLVAGKAVRHGRFETLSSTVDVLPTILGALNSEPASRDGIDLLQRVGRADRAIPLESLMGARAFGLSPVVGLRQRQWLWEASPADHLWDLHADPAEERDVAAAHADTVKELARIRNDIGIPDPNVAQEHDPETVEQLRALGYVEGAPAAGTGDVREFYVEGAKWYDEITTNLANGHFARAEFYSKKSIERYPNSTDIWINAGFAAVGLQDYSEAERRFRRALALNPDSPPPRLNLANVLLQMDRLDEAEAEYRRVLRDEPKDLLAIYNLGMLLIRQGRIDEGATYWRNFYELAPEHPRAADVKRWLLESDPKVDPVDAGRSVEPKP
jgi:arylsulfatase A-like enzyme